MSGPLSTQTEVVGAIDAEQLTKLFAGGIHALDRLTVSIPVGALTVLIGPNGSGKSTFVNVVAGTLLPTEGRLRVLGVDACVGTQRHSATIGFATQDLALDPELTGMETLRLFHALRGLSRRNRANDLAGHADAFGILSIADRRVGGYSGGERQRLHLAIETMHTPALLLFDEPTSSLDPAGRRDFWRRLQFWRDEGRSIVIATHDLHDAETHADLVLVLDRGRLIASGSPTHLAAEHGGAGVLITASEPVDEAGANAVRIACSALEDVHEIVIERRTITLWRRGHPPGHEPAIDRLADIGVGVERYERIEPGLTAAYLRLTGDSGGRTGIAAGRRRMR